MEWVPERAGRIGSHGRDADEFGTESERWRRQRPARPYGRRCEPVVVFVLDPAPLTTRLRTQIPFAAPQTPSSSIGTRRGKRKREFRLVEGSVLRADNLRTPSQRRPLRTVCASCVQTSSCLAGGVTFAFARVRLLERERWRCRGCYRWWWSALYGLDFFFLFSTDSPSTARQLVPLDFDSAGAVLPPSGDPVSAYRHLAPPVLLVRVGDEIRRAQSFWSDGEFAQFVDGRRARKGIHELCFVGSASTDQRDRGTRTVEGGFCFFGFRRRSRQNVARRRGGERGRRVVGSRIVSWLLSLSAPYFCG